MLVEQGLFEKTDKVAVAVARIKEFEPSEGYYVAFSGGKDSVVILDLVKRSGVKFDAHYNITGIDPPELYYFIRDGFPDVQRHRPEMTMWALIVKKRMPPTRRLRYCCEYLKERGGTGRRVVTGIRWAESTRRGNRKMVESCFKDGSKVYLHPIIDWSETDVWDYIHGNNLPYCSLYDEGFKRLGCIMCPMNVKRESEIKRWPRYYKKYIKAFDACLAKRCADGLETTWDSGEQMMAWWLDNAAHREDPDQTVMFE
ncbi:phosphoadenosine phosphosulfate reductase [bacterium]|nr:MAG: phosphoadenosine phosphosulfate reductase [bacterium]